MLSHKKDYLRAVEKLIVPAVAYLLMAIYFFLFFFVKIGEWAFAYLLIGIAILKSNK